MPIGTLKTRDIRRSRWFEEVVEYFNLDPSLVAHAVSGARVEEIASTAEVRKARETLEQMFMPPENIALVQRLQTADPRELSDVERSTAWKEYIFLCVNAEKRAFERLYFYEAIIECILKPILQYKRLPVVVDYGCGSSLLTRLIAQDFPGRVRTISVDVCKYAVEFSVARNRLYNKYAEGVVLEDVLASLQLYDADLLLAYAVFEHLPNSTAQIQAVIDSLAENGVLVENYSGHSAAVPQKSDTFSAYRNRDRNLDLLRTQLTLLNGRLPSKARDAYDWDSRERYWVKTPNNPMLVDAIRRKLHREHSWRKRVWRALARRLSRSRRTG